MEYEQDQPRFRDPGDVVLFLRALPLARRAQRFGGLDSCLTRSLVAGAMLSEAHDVVLHVGFRPGTEEVPLDGHAWLTVDGGRLDAIAPDDVDHPYAGILEIPFGAEGRSRG